MVNFVLQKKYDEAVAEFSALSAKLRQMKNDYEAARYTTLQQYREAQERVDLFKRELSESNEELRRDFEAKRGTGRRDR